MERIIWSALIMNKNNKDLNHSRKILRLAIIVNLAFIVTVVIVAIGIMNSKKSRSDQQLDIDQQKSAEPVVSTEQLRKGYDLPITDQEREESEQDCISKMEQIYSLYKEAKSDETQLFLSKEMAEKMMDCIKDSDCPIAENTSENSNRLNMINSQLMDTFLNQAKKGEKCEIVAFELHANCGLERRHFIYDGTNMYVLNSIGMWDQINGEDKATISYTTYNRIQSWDYTEKGWFIYDYCVPQSPEVTETVNGNVMIRVKPLDEEYMQIAEDYLKPIGYQGNNLMWLNWDQKHLSEIDYNALYQYLYQLKYHETFPNGTKQNTSDQTNGNQINNIPKDEFESLIMEYLPVTAEQLREYAVYDSETQTYQWLKLGCGNCMPNALETAFPEIIDKKVNADGTIELIIDAVCELDGSEAAISHKLTIQVSNQGKVRYLSNELLSDPSGKYPAYMYRLGNE